MANLKIFTKNIEQEALNQIYTLIEQPSFQDCKVRIMPDVHAGTGCVIGFTADLGDKVIPNIVGVDIGCGMLCVQLSEKDIDLQKLDDIIHNYVPNGREIHDVRKVKFDKLKDLYCYRNLKDIKRIEKNIGTLGGGNHFIEIDEDEEQNKYLIIHSGSRNLGKQVADYYQNLAIETMQGKDKLLEMQENLITEYKSQGKRKEIQSAIKELHKNFNPNPLKIPKELCYLTDKYREQYLHDMKICQEYAIENRATIADIILSLMNLSSEFSFETIHNYIEYKTNMIRKGAVSAKKDQMLLIPINMRDGCIVARGKGNDEWNQSAPHGAGRIMSRNKAREVVNFDDYKNSMNGIYTTSVNKETIDEAPMVYKPMKEIIDNIQDTVEIVKIIKPIYNFKASE